MKKGRWLAYSERRATTAIMEDNPFLYGWNMYDIYVVGGLNKNYLVSAAVVIVILVVLLIK